MMQTLWPRAGLAVFLAAGVALAESPPENHLNFVSCPIVRDTQTVPCWLSEYEGELYYLGIQTDISADFDPPYLGHQVLVEGIVSDQPRICGGIVLEPVVISPMPELDGTCNTILPAEDKYTVPFAPRPPGPSGGRLAYQPPPGAPVAKPEPQTGPRDFEIYHDYDMLIMGKHAPLLTQIYNYAVEIGAKRIVVTGRGGATLLSDGSRLTEPESIGRERAEEIADILRRSGLGDIDIVAQPASSDDVTDGIDDWRSRRTTVRVEP